MVKRVLQSSFACALALGLVACSAAPRVVADDDAGRAPLTTRDVAILNASDTTNDTGGSGGFALGAGDSLGQHVFTHAVALARAENGDIGWRYADASTSGGGSGGAIYPSFLGVDRPLNTFDAFETVWIYTSQLRGRDRTAPVANPNGAVTGKPAPSVIVLVPEE